MRQVKCKDGETRFLCDICNKTIPDEFSGLQCQTCGRIFCITCTVDYPIQEVEVNPKGPEYKRYQDMCSICLAKWRRIHPDAPRTKQVNLDGYIQT